MAKTLSRELVSQGEKSSSVDPRRWLMLAVLLLTTFLGTLDTYIVNVAVPSIQNNLHASFTEIQLVIAGYILAFAVVLATGGRLGDLYRRKRLLLLGVTGFYPVLRLLWSCPNGDVVDHLSGASERDGGAHAFLK